MALLPASCELIGIAVYAYKAQSSVTKSGVNIKGVLEYLYTYIFMYLHAYITYPVDTRVKSVAQVGGASRSDCGTWSSQS